MISDAGQRFDEMSPPRTCHNRAHPDKAGDHLIMGYWWCEQCYREANELSPDIPASNRIEHPPGSPEWELELCQREYREAEIKVEEARENLKTKLYNLNDCAKALGAAEWHVSNQ